MYTSEEVIELIKKKRIQKKLSVEELANKVGIGKSTLSRYENKLRKFPLHDLDRYAQALGCSTETLLGIREDQNQLDTLAAHYDGEDWTAEELEEIERFKAFVRSKRQK